jgi:RHS repeat-associated protein
MRTSLTVDEGGGPVATSYVWDVNRSLPVVLQDGTNTYVYGLDLISATDGGGGQTFFATDGLGSTTDLTDGSGDVTDTYSYDVFGALRANTGSTPNNWLFTGEQHDADSDLYYLRARYYDPATGRFLGLDPMGIGNRYSYVANNPVSFNDRSGLCFGLGDCGPIDDADNVLEDAYQSGDDAIDTARDVVGSDAFTAVSCGASPLVPAAIGPCAVSSLLNDSTRNYVLNGVQWADVAPLGVIPGFGTIPAVLIDFAAFAAGEYQILTNDCLDNGQKWALTMNNASNLGVGQAGNLIEGLPGLEWVAYPVAAYELASFELGQAGLNCHVAYAGNSQGTHSKE